MLDSLHGELVAKTPAQVTVRVGGIDFLIHVPLSTYKSLPQAGQEVRLLVHLHVRPEELSLYGFGTEVERELFRMLLGVSRVGPGLALRVLSGCSPAQFKSYVLQEDVDALRATIKGIGEKLARRLVAELRDPIKNLPVAAQEGATAQAVRDAVQALMALGEPRASAEKAVKAAAARLGPSADCQRLVQEALSQ